MKYRNNSAPPPGDVSGKVQFMGRVQEFLGYESSRDVRFARFEALVVAVNFSSVLILLGFAVQLAWPPSYWFPLINSVALLSMSPWSVAARPWPVVAGHFLTASAGISFGFLFGSSLIVGAAAASAGVLAMSLMRASHPPAAATALLFAMQPHPDFRMLLPLMMGALAVAALEIGRAHV